MTDAKRLARYDRIYHQLEDLIRDKSPGLIAAMATIVAVLHHKMPHHFWTGFYFTSDSGELHVGPYQGSLACQVLRDSGVCLHGVETAAPVVVKDVEAFPGHIACDARSKSEIVLPVKKGEKVVAVLDIDSEKLAQFDEGDVAPLQRILSLLTPFL
ncbi:MAG TPA: diguanylate cyclase [Desulfobacteraceae bacterium]|nr:diguanylate cyclase [Desulfobacteraceae bacterium]|tara:strand:+ start:298 stop:765 length:468 start_codon:yes stop_codon:yes gene_type:complete